MRAPRLSPTRAPEVPDDLPELPAMRSRLLAGFFFVIFGFFSVALWLVFAQLSGAVIAGGQVVVEGDVKKVQHQTGGIVGEILVKEGARVAANDPLLRLDVTIPRTNLAQIETQLMQLNGRRTRLEAERDGRDTIALPQGFEAQGPEAEAIAAREQRHLTESRLSRAQQASQLVERIGQFEREVEGLEAQVAAKNSEAQLISVELKGVQELFEKKLVPITRATALQREVARLGGERGSLIAAIAKARGQIAEIRLQLLSIEQRTRADAVKELGEIEGSISQLVEKRVAALDTLRRIEIRAPNSGYVHDLKAHTVGGVISPGETIMQIVPDSDRLAVDIKIIPTDIDQLRPAQKVVLRFSAFNQRTTPEINAAITRIAADATREPQTGAMYYLVRVNASPEELAKLKGLALSPGMPVEAFVETGDRSAVTYFLKPLTDAFQRAFREE